MTKPCGDSDDRPRALFVTPESPYPLAGGGALRAASVLEYLAARYEVDVISFREPPVSDPRTFFPGGLARHIEVLELPFHSRGTVARAVRNLGRILRSVPPLNDRFRGFRAQFERFLHGRCYDVAILEHFWCASYRDQILPHARLLVLDLHNVESNLYARAATIERGPRAALLRRISRDCLEWEKRWLPGFHVLLVASAQDAAKVSAVGTGGTICVVPNTIPLVPRPAVPEDDVIAFSGNFEYHPNLAAVRFFVREVWPRLRERRPALVWRLIGRNPQAARSLVRGDNSIELAGPPDDAILALAAAKAVVVPVRSGSGTRVKILEAWAAGRAIVSTSLGAEGLDARNNEHLLLADSPDAFASAICRVLDSAELRAQLGGAGRRLYEECYTWAHAEHALDQAGLSPRAAHRKVE